MVVGVVLCVGGTLTLSNSREWLVRWRLWEKFTGPEPDQCLGGATAADVLRRWIGLEIDVDAMPRNEWLQTTLVEDAVKEADDCGLVPPELDGLMNRLCHGADAIDSGSH